MFRNLQICFVVVGLIVALAATNVLAVQNSEAEASAEHQKLLQTLGVEQVETNGESFWKFGIRITAKGDAKGITATFPIPVQWPEQQVTEISKDHTENVNRVSVKKVSSEVQQVLVKINRLRDGEIAEATITFRVQKAAIPVPANPDDFRFAKKVPSAIRKHLSPSPYIESTNRTVKAAAAEIEFPEDASDWEKVEQIYRWVRDKIQYRFDTQIHTCMDALSSGHGDCEELSSLFIAICRIKGIPARAVWIPGHTYPEFYMENAKGDGQWIPCQAAGSYAFGGMNEARPILQKGDKFRVPGSRNPTRYLQPTLVAKDVAGEPVLEWISEQVQDQETGSNDR